ncbi:hypothetical protein [Gemmatimonas sp. UBA7669]|uniref:hypothetical protein n=1 Tax=Gemmatimonas sp. UBA7669 TaxID=1946568 RepID=UPI0025C658C7|nr:hypothetical protein [Gemmatimonas sp. UBA7669]
MPLDGISSLLRTTFFNIEAMFVRPRLWQPLSQTILEDNGALDGISRRCLSIILEENPFPELCVVRAYALSQGLGFGLDHRLVEYVRENAKALGDIRLREAHIRHYRRGDWSSKAFQIWLAELNPDAVMSRELNQGIQQFELALDSDSKAERAMRP